MYALDMREFLNRLQAHCHDDGSTVGISDDTFATLLESLRDVVRIEFGYNQRYALVHAEGRRVVNHDRSMTGDILCILLGHRATCRNESNIYPLEEVAMLKQFYGVFFAAESICSARRACGAKKSKGSNRELALSQNVEQFLSYGA